MAARTTPEMTAAETNDPQETKFPDRPRRETRMSDHSPFGISQKTSRTNSSPAIYDFPPPKIPPPTTLPHLTVEGPMSPAFSTAPTLGSPSSNYRTGRTSPFPVHTRQASGGVPPRKSSQISILTTEPGVGEHLVIHYSKDTSQKRVSSPQLTLPENRFIHTPDEYDSSSDKEEEDEEETMSGNINSSSSIGGPVSGSLKKVSSATVPIQSMGQQPSGGAGSTTPSGTLPIKNALIRSISGGHSTSSPVLASRGTPTPEGGLPALNMAPGARISLQFHTLSVPVSPEKTSSAPATQTGAPSTPTTHNTPLPTLPPPLPRSQPPPLPASPPPPLPPPQFRTSITRIPTADTPPSVFRSLPSSPLSSPANQVTRTPSFSSTATTVTDSPCSSAPSSPSSSMGNRSLSFSSSSYPPAMAGSTTSSTSKPLPPTPLTNIKRSMSLDSQHLQAVRQRPSTPGMVEPTSPFLVDTSTSPYLGSLVPPSSSSSSSSSSLSSVVSSSPSPSPIPQLPHGVEGILVGIPHGSPSISPAPSPRTSPSPRTLDVNIPPSPIQGVKSLSSMGAPQSTGVNSSLSRFKPRSMSQPWMLTPNSPSVHSVSSVSSELDSTSSSSSSTSMTPTPTSPFPTSHSDLLSHQAKFKNRFHSSFDDTPPVLGGEEGSNSLTKIQEVPEEEEREKEKEKLILEREVEISKSEKSGGSSSRRSSLGAATTRPPSPSSRSNSSPTTSITNSVLLSRSTSSSAGSANYSLSSLHTHALLWGQREATSFFNRPKQWKCARCKIKYPPLEHSWHCLPDKFFLCNICFNATQVSS